MEKITISVQGMTCGGCVSSVTNVLQSLDGVNKVNVTLEPAEATITYDAAKTNLAAFQQAIENAGFDIGE